MEEKYNWIDKEEKLKIVIYNGEITINDNCNYITVAIFLGDKYYSDADKIKYGLNNKTKGNKTILECLKNYDNQPDTAIFKYRPYFKAVKKHMNINKKDNILTFILFNPSYTNQNSLDDTVANCAKISLENGYDGFEILNLFNIRNPKIKDVIKSNESNCNIKIKPVFQNIVFAWGCRYFSKDIMNLLNDNLKNFLNYKQNNSQYFVLCKKDNRYITRHAGNQAWVKCPDKPKLMRIKEQFNDIEILKAGEIKLKK